MLYIHDDATAATITEATVQAVGECARMVGKLGTAFNSEQLEQIEAAIQRLQRMVELKRETANANRT